MQSYPQRHLLLLCHVPLLFCVNMSILKCVASVGLVLMGAVLCTSGAPQQQQQQYYMHDVVKQAHTMHLLPQEAVVDKTAPGIQVS